MKIPAQQTHHSSENCNCLGSLDGASLYFVFQFLGMMMATGVNSTLLVFVWEKGKRSLYDGWNAAAIYPPESTPIVKRRL